MRRSQALLKRPKLSRKRAKFVREYLIDLNASQAAIRAGYSPRSATSQASELLTFPNVRAAIDAKLSECELTASRTLREIGRIAYQDPGELFDEAGKLKAVSELAPHTRAAVAQVEVLKRNLTSGDGTTEEVHRVRLWDKNKALELAAKYLRLLDEHREHDVKIEISWKPRAQLAIGQSELAASSASGQAIEAPTPIDVEVSGEPNTHSENHNE